jgi:hypothetical protein
VTPNQWAGGPGPARQGSAPCTDFSARDRVFVSCSSPPTPRTRQVRDLFQPVTSSQPPAAALTDQPISPVTGLAQEDELFSAPAPQSGYALGARWWAGRGAGLVVGMPWTVIALVASAALVVVMAGMTISTTSSSTEPAVAELAPGRLPAPVIPAISDAQSVTVAPIDAPAGLAQQTPTKAYSPDPSPVPAHRQPLPAAHRALPAPPPAPDHGPVFSPWMMPPPSTMTTEDAEDWTITTGSHTENRESPTTDIEPCNCDSPRRKIPHHGDRPSKVDRQPEPRAPQPGYRSTGMAQEPRFSKEGKQDE